MRFVLLTFSQLLDLILGWVFRRVKIHFPPGGLGENMDKHFVCCGVFKGIQASTSKNFVSEELKEDDFHKRL